MRLVLSSDLVVCHICIRCIFWVNHLKYIKLPYMSLSSSLAHLYDHQSSGRKCLNVNLIIDCRFLFHFFLVTYIYNPLLNKLILPQWELRRRSNNFQNQNTCVLINFVHLYHCWWTKKVEWKLMKIPIFPFFQLHVYNIPIFRATILLDTLQFMYQQRCSSLIG